MFRLIFTPPSIWGHDYQINFSWQCVYAVPENEYSHWNFSEFGAVATDSPETVAAKFAAFRSATKAEMM